MRSDRPRAGLIAVTDGVTCRCRERASVVFGDVDTGAAAHTVEQRTGSGWVGDFAGLGASERKFLLASLFGHGDSDLLRGPCGGGARPKQYGENEPNRGAPPGDHCTPFPSRTHEALLVDVVPAIQASSVPGIGANRFHQEFRPLRWPRGFAWVEMPDPCGRGPSTSVHIVSVDR